MTICNNCKFCKKKWIGLSDCGYGRYEFLCRHENNRNEVTVDIVSSEKSYYRNSLRKYEDSIYPPCGLINKGDCKDYQPSWWYKLKMFFKRGER